MAMPSAVHGRWRFPLRKPPALGPGARLAVVAPASAFDVGAFHAGWRNSPRSASSRRTTTRCSSATWYLAGAPAVRAAALERAWRDPSIDGIIAVRGGYGSVHLLPLLDPDLPRRHPKVFIGYSDITSLHIWLGQLGQVAFQGPMIEGRLALGAERYDRDAFLRAVTPRARSASCPRRRSKRSCPGKPPARSVGGTLTQLAASLGTPFAFDPPHGCVLFLEDVAERPYRLDRLVTQLRLAGILSRAAAIVLGTFPGCDEPGGEPDGARDARLCPARRSQGPWCSACPSATWTDRR